MGAYRRVSDMNQWRAVRGLDAAKLSSDSARKFISLNKFGRTMGKGGVPT